MRIAGIVGGMGPESTIAYYRQIIALWRAHTHDGSYPSLLIRSVDLKAMLDLVAAAAFDDLTAFLVAEIERLARAGADFAVLAANTPHVVFEDVQQRSPIPLISIVDATCAEMTRRGIRRAGLLGTRFTMQGQFYPDVCGRAGIQIVIPRPDERTYIHDKYLSELIPGQIVPATRDRLLAIIRRVIADEGIGAVILGGTELPLLLSDDSVDGVPLLDTTAIHVRRIVDVLAS